MKRSYIGIALLAILPCGCMENVVQRKANLLTRTVPEMYYSEVMDNLAMLDANPAAMPYFGIPQQGTNSNTRNIQATYTPGWDFLITPISMTKKILERYIFDKQTAAVQGQYQNQESFQVAPLNDPDKMVLIYAAIMRVLGKPIDPDLDNKLTNFYNSHDGIVNYNNFVNPGYKWVRRAKTKHGIPHGTKNWACYGDCYIWVSNNDLPALTEFALALLDIATIDTTRLSQPTTPDASKNPVLELLSVLTEEEQNTFNAMEEIEKEIFPELYRAHRNIRKSGPMIWTDAYIYGMLSPSHQRALENLNDKEKRLVEKYKTILKTYAASEPSYSRPLLTPRMSPFPYPAPPNFPIVQ